MNSILRKKLKYIRITISYFIYVKMDIDQYLDYEEPETRHKSRRLMKSKRMMYSRPKFEKKKFHRIFHKHSKEYAIGGPLTCKDKENYNQYLVDLMKDEPRPCTECAEYVSTCIEVTKREIIAEKNKSISLIKSSFEKINAKFVSSIKDKYAQEIISRTTDIKLQIKETEEKLHQLQLSLTSIEKSVHLEKLYEIDIESKKLGDQLEIEKRKILDEFNERLNNEIDDIIMESKSCVCVRHDPDTLAYLDKIRKNQDKDVQITEKCECYSCETYRRCHPFRHCGFDCWWCGWDDTYDYYDLDDSYDYY